MCDNDTLEDMIEYQLRSAGLSRRRFGALSLGVGVISLLPPVAGAAAEVQESEVDIKTPDGTADAYFVHPSRGTYPAVLMWPDIYGLRPAFRQMGRRLAESGYSVLVVNPFYRTKRAPTAAEHADFEDPATRAALVALSGGASRSRRCRCLLSRRWSGDRQSGQPASADTEDEGPLSLCHRRERRPAPARDEECAA